MKKAVSLTIFMSTLILTLELGIAQGADWKRIAEYEDTFIYVDKESIRHVSDSVISALFRIEYREPFWVGAKSVDYYTIAQDNDCVASKYRVSRLVMYFRDGAERTFSPEEEHPVNPDTFQSVIHQFICKESR